MNKLENLADDFAPWQARVERGEKVVASFKCEDFDEQTGEEIGPFRLEAPDEATNDPNLTRHEGSDGRAYFTQPFGYQPDWAYSVPFWIHRTDAVRFAETLGVRMEES